VNPPGPDVRARRIAAAHAFTWLRLAHRSNPLPQPCNPSPKSASTKDVRLELRTTRPRSDKTALSRGGRGLARRWRIAVAAAPRSRLRRPARTPRTDLVRAQQDGLQTIHCTSTSPTTSRCSLPAGARERFGAPKSLSQRRRRVHAAERQLEIRTVGHVLRGEPARPVPVLEAVVAPMIPRRSGHSINTHLDRAKRACRTPPSITRARWGLLASRTRCMRAATARDQVTASVAGGLRTPSCATASRTSTRDAAAARVGRPRVVQRAVAARRHGRTESPCCRGKTSGPDRGGFHRQGRTTDPRRAVQRRTRRGSAARRRGTALARLQRTAST